MNKKKLKRILCIVVLAIVALVELRSYLRTPQAEPAQQNSEVVFAINDAPSQGISVTDSENELQTPEKEPEESAFLTVTEDGEYTSKEEVALYIHNYGHLPSNFISKTKAKNAGWVAEKGNLHIVCPGKSIGGSFYGNYEGLLPDAKGRQWTECDINYKKGSRGAERIVFSNDGLIFYSPDHYETFEQLY